MKIYIFLKIPIYPTPFAVQNSLTNQFDKKLKFLDISNNNKKYKFFRDPSLHFSFALLLLLLKISRNLTFWVKLIG